MPDIIEYLPEQYKALDPKAQLWFAASAGSGKTEILSARYINLLLQGASPYHICAITYTNNGANEMRQRITKKLRKWLELDDKALQQQIMGIYPNFTQDNGAMLCKRARQIFAQVIETTGGLRIFTIHSFCQLILSHFPLEAGISPNHALIQDADNARYIRESLYKALEHLSHIHKIHIYEATRSDIILEKTALALMKERQKMRALLELNSIESYLDGLITIAEPYKGSRHVDDYYPLLLQSYYTQDGVIDIMKRLLFFTGEHYSKRKPHIDMAYQAMSTHDYAMMHDAIKKTLLTKDYKIERNLYKKLEGKAPNLLMLCDNIRQGFERLRDEYDAIKTYHLSWAMALLMQQTFKHYQHSKNSQGLLDYDDMIDYTLRLLQDSTHIHPWVEYKMDGFIEHYLLDEAQDTNPDQWLLLQQLIKNFNQHYQDNIPYTMFVVGDEKQSIFRFQRADPKIYQQQYNDIKQVIPTMEHVSFNRSFRSSPVILAVADMVLKHKKEALGITDELQHHANFKGSAGVLELWPEFLYDAKEHDKKDMLNIYTEMLVLRIKKMLNGEYLPGTDTVIEPHHIMILLKKRAPLAQRLYYQCKRHNIKVQGLDRFILNDDLAALDLLSLGLFSVTPYNDHNLVGLLQSSFIGLAHETIMPWVLAKGNLSLWNYLQHMVDNTADSTYKPIIAWLRGIIYAPRSHLHLWYVRLLHDNVPHIGAKHHISGTQAFISRLGHSAYDSIASFLSVLRQYEHEHGKDFLSFYDYIMQDDTSIKRDIEDDRNEIRIITVHGAKGLEAPIIIMPDTMDSLAKINNSMPFIMANSTIPLYAGHKNLPYIGDYVHQETIEEEAESIRLLYVALTRAKQYILVASFGKLLKDDAKRRHTSWYYIIKNELEKSYIADTWVEDSMLNILAPLTAKSPLGKYVGSLGTAYIYGTKSMYNTRHHEQASPADHKAISALNSPKMPSYGNDDRQQYAWLRQKITQANPLNKTAKTYVTAITTRPVPPAELKDKAAHDLVKLQGVLTHELLQKLPVIDVSKQQEHGVNISNNARYNFIEKHHKRAVVANAISIINHHDFAFIFGPNTQSECPIIGRITKNDMDAIMQHSPIADTIYHRDMRGPIHYYHVNGVIDRLYIDDTTIMLVDYKTNKKPPKTAKSIPISYQQQLRLYAHILKTIYPKHDIKAYILWTSNSELMPCML